MHAKGTIYDLRACQPRQTRPRDASIPRHRALACRDFLPFLFSVVSDVTIVNVLGAGIARLISNAGVVRRLLGLRRTPSEFGGVSETENLPCKLSERPVDLIFRPLHR